MFTDPVKNLKAFGLKENAIVADLGAGTGFYAVLAGKMVPRGKVYAVEISKDYLSLIKHKANEAHVHNIEIIQGDVEKRGGTKIKDGIADDVIASNVLFQVADRDNFLFEINRILKPKGRVLLIDWSESPLVHAGRTISKNKAREIFEKKGFTYDREINAGSHHYGMIFVKS